MPDAAVHQAWIRFVLREALDLDDDVLAEGQAIPQSLHASAPEHGETLRPNLVLLTPKGRPDAGKARLLIQTYPASQDLGKPVAGKPWKVSPATRMAELCHHAQIRLGLVTDGGRRMLVDATRGETIGFASWHAELWLEEPATLRAFRSLLNVQRFFGVDDKDTLEALVAESASNQQEVTDRLGAQVRSAVEMLIQSIDKADQEYGRALLADVSEAELYEAALTVMMRLVFLFCGEEQGLLLLCGPLFNENYAVSTLSERLRETADKQGEEILERRHGAWCRLLATFRAVHGGVEHERMRLPACGGHLFDPDRFPFLEGRKRGICWREASADPLPVDNRTVLHLLEALQLLKVKLAGGGPPTPRRVSFRALDIEQIGHVYEGLLDHAAKRATEPVLGLTGSKNKEPEVPLSKLEDIKRQGDEKLLAFLTNETGRSLPALKKALSAQIEAETAARFVTACGADDGLWKRVRPFAALVRPDSYGHPVVVPQRSVYVTAGTDRRSSGTHYTPRRLTEPIVRHALEPLVYEGPAEGKPPEEWRLLPARELLDLKICDLACGSGVFLVKACRDLAALVVEAWEQAEQRHPGDVRITPYGEPSGNRPEEQLVPKDADERLTHAQRLVAQRCLYGVDINPLAVEMAKLSLWLLTLAKDRPFTFVDHAIRCGDSLVGIHDLDQLRHFSLKPDASDAVLFGGPLEEAVEEAVRLRLKIEVLAANTAEVLELQESLLAEADERILRLRLAADLLVSAELWGENPKDKQERCGMLPRSPGTASSVD